MKEICLFCHSSYEYYKFDLGLIPPAGKLNLKKNIFICDKCITDYYLESNSIIDFLEEKRKREKGFNEELFNSIKYFIPSIFRLSRKKISNQLREQILKKCNYTCVECNSKENLTIDHIKAYSKRGSDKAENLQVLCKSCNSKKGDR